MHTYAKPGGLPTPHTSQLHTSQLNATPPQTLDVKKRAGRPISSVTSDRGPQFASAFTKALNKKLDISLRLSTAHHPQTDGSSERAIQTLKQFLRIYCHDRQTWWANGSNNKTYNIRPSHLSHTQSPPISRTQSLYNLQPVP